VYKDNYRHIGAVMAGYFPDGITLKTAEDHIRFHLFMLIHVKLTRYTNQWANGHADSLVDASVYSAMLRQVDGEFLRTEPKPKIVAAEPIDDNSPLRRHASPFPPPDKSCPGSPRCNGCSECEP
jgi:hypothetical protein